MPGTGDTGSREGVLGQRLMMEEGLCKEEWEEAPQPGNGLLPPQVKKPVNGWGPCWPGTGRQEWPSASQVREPITLKRWCSFRQSHYDRRKWSCCPSQGEDGLNQELVSQCLLVLARHIRNIYYISQKEWHIFYLLTGVLLFSVSERQCSSPCHHKILVKVKVKVREQKNLDLGTWLKLAKLFHWIIHNF